MARAWERWAAAGVLCAAAAGWYAWSAAPAAPAAAARPAGGRAPAGRAPAELADAAAEAGQAGREERGELSAEAAVPLPPPDPPGIALEPPVEGGFPLRVVRGRTEEPAAFALVGFGEMRPVAGVERLAREAHDSPRAKQVDALKHYRADAQGRLQVPRTKRTSHAFASCNGEWGWLDVFPDRATGERVLRVFPDQAVAVRVVSGPERAPVAGAEVGLRYETSPGDSTLLDVAETGAGGVARFEHLREYVEYYWEHTEKLSAVVCGVFADPPEAVLDPENVPELVELVLPACTELEVRLVGADGAPVRAPALVRAAPAGEQAGDDLGRTAAGVARDGVIVFDQIGPGLDLALSAHTDEAATAAVSSVRSAPQAGGRAVAVVELGRAWPVLAGRLLDPDGAPAAQRMVAFALMGEDGRAYRGASVETDAAGAFRLALRGELAKQPRLLIDARIEEQGRSLSAATALDGPFEAGEHPLPDLRLSEDPLLVSGRVVAASGEGVAEAVISITAVLPSGGRRFAARARSGPDGAFEARGWLPSAPLLLWAEHPGYATPGLVQAAPGATRVEIALLDAGRIEGSVLFDEEWFCDFAYVRAKRDGAADWTDEAQIERPGFFSLPALAAGAWTVEVCMSEEAEGGATFAGVSVAAGEVTRDPRLQDVDLRGKARYVALRVVGEDGAPVEEGLVYHRRPGSAVWSESAYVENGRAYVFTQLAELDLYATAEGRRAAFVAGARDGREIVLAEGIPVRFRWAGEPPPADRTLSATYECATALPGLPALSAHAPIAGAGEQFDPAPFPEAGRYDVLWTLLEWNGQGWAQIDALREPLVILDRSGAEDYELSVPAAFRARVEAAPKR